MSESRLPVPEGPAVERLRAALSNQPALSQRAEAALREVAETCTIDARVVNETYETKIAEFNPAPGVTVVLKMPEHAPREAFEAAQQGLKHHFPDHKIVVMHDNAELTTDE